MEPQQQAALMDQNKLDDQSLPEQHPKDQQKIDDALKPIHRDQQALWEAFHNFHYEIFIHRWTGIYKKIVQKQVKL